MYGTVARMKVKRENLEKLQSLMMEQQGGRQVAGFRASHVLIPDAWNDEIVLLAIFDDKATYEANADDPAQHEDYVKYRALLEAEPEWTDGEIVSNQA